MRLSEQSLDRLTRVITGDSRQSRYRTGPELIEFFYDFGERDLYGKSFPARGAYVLDKLRKFNGTEIMKKIVCRAFDFLDDKKFDAVAAGDAFNQVLTRDGFRLEMEYGPGWMSGNDYVRGYPYFEVRSLTGPTVVPTGLASVGHGAIAEQIAKTNAKIETGDFSGSIASAYTLVEELLKLLLLATGTGFKTTNGDIRSLYRLLRGPMRLDPSDNGINEPLKPILDGLQKLVGGLYEIANKASDRHARQYNPLRHHAKLAVNAAFVLCEFLVESYEYQKAR